MKNRLKLVLWIGVVLMTLISQYLMAGYTMDDAFISFRYARNVATGQGWVYNAGEPPVEGFSNFLWTLLLVPSFWFRIDPMLYAQTIGILCSLGVLWFAAKLAESGVENPHGIMPLGAPLLLCLTGSFTYQAVTGLETQLFTLGLIYGIYFFLGGDSRSLYHSAAGFLVASLCRPEGIPLFALSLLFLAVRCWKRSVDYSSLWRFLFAYLIPMALFWVWRVKTFGDYLPNTYYAKIDSPFETIPEGAKYVYRFFQTQGTALPWAVALLPLAWRRRRPRESYLYLICVAYLAMVIYEGGDWMPLSRFIAPILPVLFVLVAGGFDHLREGWNQIKLERKVALFTIHTLTLGWILVIAAVLLYPSIAVIVESQVRPELYRHSHIALGQWLRQQCQPGDRVALSDIGQIGYYSGLPVIDLVGLTDRTIAHSPGGMHKKQYDPLYVLNQKPRYVVLVCAKVGGRWVIRGFETDKRLYHHPRFKAEYRLLPDVSLSFQYKDDYSYWIFERIAESGLDQ